jgi:Transposase
MKLIKTTPVKTRRKFDETFKRAAVQNWLASGKSAEVIAQELDLHADQLYAWKKLKVSLKVFNRDPPGPFSPADPFSLITSDQIKLFGY